MDFGKEQMRRTEEADVADLVHARFNVAYDLTRIRQRREHFRRNALNERLRLTLALLPIRLYAWINERIRAHELNDEGAIAIAFT